MCLQSLASSEGKDPEKRAIEDEKSAEFDGPDGGWGWMVVVGAFLSNMTMLPSILLFGLLFSDRVGDLNISTSGESLIMAVNTAFLNFSGLFVGALCRKFSYRRVAVFGAMLTSSGLMLTSFANSVPTFIMTYSICTGIGVGLFLPCTFVAVNSYFTRNNGIAVGCSVTGTGVGQAILPFIINYFLSEYGFSGTILVFSAFSSHAVAGALLYRPASRRVPKKIENEPTKIAENGKVKLEGIAENSQKGVTVLSMRVLSECEVYWTHHCSQCADRQADILDQAEESDVLEKLKKLFDLDLLHNWSFVFLITGVSLVSIGNNLFLMLFPLFMKSMMFSTDQIACSLTIHSTVDTVCRPILPFIVRFFQLRVKTVFFASALFFAIARSALVSQNQIIPIFVFMAISGLFRAAIYSNVDLTVAEGISLDKMPSAIGLQMFFSGVGNMVLAPIVGVIRDATQSFPISIYIVNIFFLGLPFAFWLSECLYKKCRIAVDVPAKS